ncbi:MAG: type secretion protein DotI [Francisellaceae bacterium]|nr:type secretion protein DotI [Francisellaceae bacterium]
MANTNIPSDSNADIKKELNEYFQSVYKTNFYYDKIGKIVFLVLLSLGLGTLLGLLLLYQKTLVPKPVFFASTPDEQIIQEPPLVNPYVSENALLNWVNEAIMSSFSYNYTNYDKLLSTMKEYFTEEGYRDYMNAITDPSIGQATRVILDKSIVKSSPKDTPNITRQGLIKGERYGWEILVPSMNITFYNPNFTTVKTFKVTLLVVRAPTMASHIGTKIFSFSMESTP